MREKRGGRPAGQQEGGGEAEAAPRVPINGRTGAIVMRSVSIFLASGRKVSVASRRQQSSSSAGGGVSHRCTEARKRRRMPEDAARRSAAYYAKVVESLRKTTKFSK